jgi:hypothetical protein
MFSGFTLNDAVLAVGDSFTGAVSMSSFGEFAQDTVNKTQPDKRAMIMNLPKLAPVGDGTAPSRMNFPIFVFMKHFLLGSGAFKKIYPSSS